MQVDKSEEMGEMIGSFLEKLDSVLEVDGGKLQFAPYALEVFKPEIQMVSDFAIKKAVNFLKTQEI